MDGRIKKVTGAENKGVYEESDRREWRAKVKVNGGEVEVMTSSDIHPAALIQL